MQLFSPRSAAGLGLHSVAASRASPPWMTSGGTKAKELSIAVIDKGCFLLIYYEVSRSIE